MLNIYKDEVTYEIYENGNKKGDVFFSRCIWDGIWWGRACGSGGFINDSKYPPQEQAEEPSKEEAGRIWALYVKRKEEGRSWVAWGR